MKQYYFLICSLPYIKLAEAPLVSIGEFRTLCKGQVNEKDMQLLDAVSLSPGKDNPFSSGSAIDQWMALEKTLRQRMAVYRMALKSEKSGRFAPKTDILSEIDRGIRDAYAKPNPAEREKALDSMRWQWLDELELGHYFDINKLFIYKLRLLIHDKWLRRNNETGYGNFERIVNIINSRTLNCNQNEAKVN
ncbi:MAG: DUF2764 family protein [Victivallaceae bacterium]